MTSAELVEVEIEVSPTNGAARIHTVVHPQRLVGGEVVHAALFAQLTAGEYTFPDWPERHPGTVTIKGGEVTEIDWRHLPLVSSPDQSGHRHLHSSNTPTSPGPARADYTGVHQ